MKRRIFKLVRHSAGRLRQELDREKRFFIFFLEPFGGEMEVCWPENNVPEFGKPTALAVQTCFKRQRSVLIHDSKVDPLTGSLGGADFRSALCVPLFDKVNNPMGVIYVDSKEVGSLDKSDRLAIELFSRKISPRIPKWTAADIGSKEAGEPSSVSASVKPLLLVACLVLFFSGAWLLAPATPGEKRVARGEATPIVKRKKLPEDALKSFRVLLNLREYGQAWSLLSPELQSKLPEESFIKMMKKWMSDEEDRWDFQRREILSASIQGSTATVYLEPGEAMEGEETWTYQVELIEEKWLINKAQGGGPLGVSGASSRGSQE